MKILLTSLVAAALAITATQSASANAVINGDFTNGLTGWNVSGSGTTPGQGLTVVTANGVAQSDQYGDAFPTTPDGSTHAIYFVDDNANKSLMQSISLLAHTTYDLTFALLATSSGAANPNAFTVTDSIGGAVSSFTSSSLAVGSWTTETLQFTTQAAGNYLLDFNFTSGATPAKDVALSDVAVNAVPEPASMALVGAALFGLGMTRRRNVKARNA